jgi:hypothetical protein
MCLDQCRGHDSALAVEAQHQVEQSFTGGRRHSGPGIASGFEDLRNLEEQMNQMSMNLTVRQTRTPAKISAQAVMAQHAGNSAQQPQQSVHLFWLESQLSTA